MERTKSFSTMSKFRKWDKVIEPIMKYTRSSSQMGYPLDFFYELERILSNGHVLALNIATTLSGAKDNCIKTCFRESEQVGQIAFSAGVLKSTFDSDVQREWQDRLTKLCQRDSQFDAFYSSLRDNNAVEQILPCALIKQKSGEQEGALQCSVLTLSRDEYKKLPNLEGNQIAQCFIWGSSKQASMIRFFYYPQKLNSEAFKIDNLEGFMQRRYGKGQFKVRETTQNSLTFVKIMFSNKSFYAQTLSLVEFLQRHLKIKISKIVTDWVLDPNNRYFLIDLKELKYEKKPEVIRYSQSPSQALAYLSCAVCQQKFRSDQITKTLTDKLISQFFQHLKKRQINLSFTPLQHRSVETSRLCDLCYMLVVSQAKLMELERSIATATHSISSEIQAPSKFSHGNQCGQMYEWRLFLYLQDIRDLKISEESEKGFYVMMRLHNSITSFKIKDPTAKYNLIKGIKVHYLFSESLKIEKFLSSSEITVRITKGPNWNSVIAEGSTSGLYEQGQKYSMRKFKQILLFDANSHYSVIGMHIGLRMQGRYNPTSLTLTKHHDVHMVGSYSNCYSLPAEWMETIDPSYCITKSQTTSFNYGLHLNKVEQKALFLQPMGKKNTKRLAL